MSGGSGRRRIRLFVLLSGALILASLVPLAVAEAVLIRRNRRTLETLEEKYLTRSSAAIADHISAYYAASAQQLTKAADAIRLAVRLTGKDPFGSADGPGIMGSVLRGQGQLAALRGVNLEGRGSFVGPDLHSPEMDFQFRKGFESARDGVRYASDPFPVAEIGAVAVLAEPVLDEKGTRIGVVEALVSWQPIVREFQDEARREVRATLVDRRGRILFPPATGARGASHPSTLVADFVRFPARVTRSETTVSGAVLASIAPVGDPPWGVLVERDRDIAFASVDSMVRDTLLWSAACLAGALLLGLYFARRLSRPIAQLAESTRAVSQGQYGASVEVTGTAEIADLSENFNVMSASIRDAFEKVQKAARENQELFISSIRALAAAIDAKDPYTRGHSERVARYSSAIAREMGLPPEDVRKARLSALLHDVGKIGVDDRIIRKPTALTDEEFELMKAHPVKGAAIMETIPQLADIIPGMKYHHEKWEGGGYPDGLKGEQIPMQARIVAVADAFDAMTTTRPYQKAMEVSYVIARLREMSQKRFDGTVVEALARSHAKGELVPADAGAAPRQPGLGPMRKLVLGAGLAALVLCAAGCPRSKPKTSAELLLNERMAQVLLRDSRPLEAEKAFKECLKDDPKNPEVLDGLGVSILMQGRYKDALPWLDKAVSLAPENGSYRNNRGVARMEIGQFKAAEEDFTAASASTNPDDRLSATINMGRLRQRTGDYAGAEQEFTTAIARDPKSYGAFIGRAVARESAGKLEGAAEDYLSAVKLEPTSADANLRLGMVLVSLHKPDLGKRYLQRAVDLDPAGDVGAKARLLLENMALAVQ